MNGITALPPNPPQKENTPTKFHPNAATSSAILPGTGQLMKGEVKSGLARLAVDTAAIGTTVALLTGKINPHPKVGLPLLGVALSASIIGRVNSAFEAFKPKQPKLDKQA